MKGAVCTTNRSYFTRFTERHPSVAPKAALGISWTHSSPLRSSNPTIASKHSADHGYLCTWLHWETMSIYSLWMDRSNAKLTHTHIWEYKCFLFKCSIFFLFCFHLKFTSAFFFKVSINFLHACYWSYCEDSSAHFYPLMFKGVMTWEKSNVHIFNKAKKMACLDTGEFVTSLGQMHLHMTASRARHRAIVIHHNNIGPAHWCSVT